MNPGTADRPGSRLKSDVSTADVIVVTTRYDDWGSPTPDPVEGSIDLNGLCTSGTFGPWRLYVDVPKARADQMSATLVRTEPSLESDRRPTLAGRLSRRMSSGRYMPEVDGVRFLAIGIVLAVHLFAVAGLSSRRLVIVPPFGPIIAGSTRNPGLVAFLQYGHVGVYLFFILSGFVLALPFIRWRVMGAGRIALSAYFLRRVTRIEPPFIVVAIVLFLLSIALHESSTGQHLAATLAYSHQAAYGQLSPIDGVFWSLEAEVQWYLVVPLLAVVLCRGTSRERLLLISIALVGAVVVQVWLGIETSRGLLSWTFSRSSWLGGSSPRSTSPISRNDPGTARISTSSGSRASRSSSSRCGFTRQRGV